MTEHTPLVIDDVAPHHAPAPRSWWAHVPLAAGLLAVAAGAGQGANLWRSAGSELNGFLTAISAGVLVGLASALPRRPGLAPWVGALGVGLALGAGHLGSPPGDLSVTAALIDGAPASAELLGRLGSDPEITSLPTLFLGHGLPRAAWAGAAVAAAAAHLLIASLRRGQRRTHRLGVVGLCCLCLHLLQDAGARWAGVAEVTATPALLAPIRPDGTSPALSLQAHLSQLTVGTGLRLAIRFKVPRRLQADGILQAVQAARPGAAATLYPGPGQTRVSLEDVIRARVGISRQRGDGPPAAHLRWRAPGGGAVESWVLLGNDALVDPLGRFRVHLTEPPGRAPGGARARVRVACSEDRLDLEAEAGATGIICARTVQVLRFTPAFRGGGGPADAPPLEPAAEVSVTSAASASGPGDASVEEPAPAATGWIFARESLATKIPPPDPALQWTLDASRWDLPGPPGIELVRNARGKLEGYVYNGETAQVLVPAIEAFPTGLSAPGLPTIEILDYLGDGSQPGPDIQPTDDGDVHIARVRLDKAEASETHLVIADDPGTVLYTDGARVSFEHGPDPEASVLRLQLSDATGRPLVEGPLSTHQALAQGSISLRLANLSARPADGQPRVILSVTHRPRPLLFAVGALSLLVSLLLMLRPAWADRGRGGAP